MGGSAMPPIVPIPILGDLYQMAMGLKLPTKSDWKQPSGSPAASHYGDALSVPDKIAIPKTITPEFMPQNMNKYHQDSCDTVGRAFKIFRLRMLAAVTFAHTMWKLQAKFSIKINAVTALGPPGCLDGPSLESRIKYAPTAATMSGNEAKYRDAVAKGVAKCFKSWQDAVTVPGLPWYPAFAAFPGPMAPPMPNVPMPLIACLSAMMTDIVTPFSMKDEMVSALDGGLKDKDPDKQHEVLFESIAIPLALAFLMWLPMQQITLVMGKGPIPTFAPPYVPVGPVVMGDNIPAPGHQLA
jgi:hypothetical protein